MKHLITLVMLCLSLTLAQSRPLTVAFQGGAVTMDPHMRQEITTISWQRHIYENLIRLERDGSFSPELALTWEAEGENTWRITLREGVLWHDGSPFTAEDVVYSLDRAANHPNSQMGQFLTGLAEVIAEDELTVRISTAVPEPLMPLKLAQLRIVNAVYTETAGNDGMALNPMGTGPYRAVSFLTDDNLLLEAFPDYWGEQPEFTDVRLVNIPNGSTRVAALLSGDVDVAEKILPQDMARVEASRDAYITQAPSIRVIYLTMDFECETDCPGSGLPEGENPFRDVRVRQAVAHAINTDAIIRRVMGGAASPATQYIAPATFGFDAELERLPYDPERARELLAEAGYPGGFSIRLDAPSDRYLNDAIVAQAIGGMLGAVGIDTTVNAVTRTVFFPAMDNRDFVMYLAGWGSPDIVGSLNTLVHTRDTEAGFGTLNRYRYSNPEVDALIRAANAEFDDEARAELIRQVNEQTLLEDVVWVPLYLENVIIGVREGIEYTADGQEFVLAWEMQRQ